MVWLKYRISIFDGRFENYTVNDGLADNEILKIFVSTLKTESGCFCFNGSLTEWKAKITINQNSPLFKKLATANFTETFYANDHDSIWVYK